MAGKRKKTFLDVLTEAIADMRRHGFDSEKRHRSWVTILRKAAWRFVSANEEIDRFVRRTLSATYTRLVTGGAIARSHNVPAYTVKNLSPTLRRELTRRIVASANVIKLNRDQAIDQTLQRFSGWATAQNPGQNTPNAVRALKSQIAKPLRQQTFEQRRVTIDQNAKLAANLNYLVARNNKAIAVVWEANAGRPHYNHRKEHLALQGKIFVLRDGWAYQQGYITKGAGFYENTDGFGVLPFCSCFGKYLYHLRQLPDEMLTTKAREALGKK